MNFDFNLADFFKIPIHDGVEAFLSFHFSYILSCFAYSKEIISLDEVLSYACSLCINDTISFFDIRPSFSITTSRILISSPDNAENFCNALQKFIQNKEKISDKEIRNTGQAHLWKYIVEQQLLPALKF